MKKNTSLPFHKVKGITISRDNLLQTIEVLLEPFVVILCTWGIGMLDEGEMPPQYLILSLILFTMTFPGRSTLNLPLWRLIRNTLVSWMSVAFLLLFFAYAARFGQYFSSQAIVAWLWVTPLSVIIANLLLRLAAPTLIMIQGPRKRAVIAGMNEQGVLLANTISHHKFVSTDVLGFFEDRKPNRQFQDDNFPLLGSLNDLPNYVRSNDISTIYLSLPMASQPRILKILDDLKDTTASIYFVPDTFMTDLIQGHMGQIDGIPVVAVCETPFQGFNGFLKRVSDIGFSLVILILISPVMLAIALAVKLTSPGPIIFKQRRYGLDGKEILIYKFRSMTVCEDNPNQIIQAQKEDSRITPLGAFLRKTSLDELPQFINVLQGRMSVVGPRPHAVAHNEMYRKQIKGYMVRHKVKPGITGWAQVNGLRGETDTLEKMKKRIEFDLDYLRNWSLRLDSHIILKTVLVVFKDQNAY
jgi:putative colanic acid biosynthesis UDP-glucose lipid carrier transferase